MYISYSNEIVDQFSKETFKFEKVKYRLISSTEVDSYKRHIANKKSIVQDIKNAIKFKIPSCDQLISDDLTPFEVLKKFVDIVNLPFPCICLELEAFSVGLENNIPSLVVAKQEGEYIHIYTINKTTEWQLMESEDDDLIYIELNRITHSSIVKGFKQENYDQSKLPLILNWFNKVPLRSVVNLICTLSCSNAHIEDHPDKPSKLKNDLRKKKNKLPFFEFKILTIDSGKSKNSEPGKSTGGSHASPRVHLRRGHIRKLPTKNVWVNACVVGDKSKGEITKEYLVK